MASGVLLQDDSGTLRCIFILRLSFGGNVSEIACREEVNLNPSVRLGNAVLGLQIVMPIEIPRVSPLRPTYGLV